MSREHDRRRRAGLYGPGRGDRIRLADTDLVVEVEEDLTTPGEEAVFGGGKVLRVGMGQEGARTRAGCPEIPDTVITNVVIVGHDAVRKADVAIRDGRISAIGQAGNPDVQEGVTIPVGVATDVIAGEGRILTAGAVDSHVHFIGPAQVDVALAAGVTTMIGGGTGPSAATRATTVTPGPWHLHRMLQAAESLPVNIALLGKGHATATAPLEEQIRAGAAGLKVHEDHGATPAAIDLALTVAEEQDVQVALHTDTLNESGFVAETVAAFRDRVVHAFHTEGAGGGHAPDIITVAALPNVLPASTNPTLPFTVNTIEEHLDMLMVCHHLNPELPEDVAFADSRIRPETIAAEDVLQDMGAISITSSDSQAMGRVGEVITRTWQTAHAMKRARGPLPEDAGTGADNTRVRRYVAKYTVNPALAAGIADTVGSVAPGRLADLVLWEPAFFGIRPELVIKGGHIVSAQQGEANASVPTCEPVFPRPQFATLGGALPAACVTFLPRAAIAAGLPGELGLRRRIRPVVGIRGLRKSDLPGNGATPRIEVDPETYRVRVDGEEVGCPPAAELPLARLYRLF